MNDLRELIGENLVYFIVDETTDLMRRCVVNVMVGKLDGEDNNSYLLATYFNTVCNNLTIQDAVKDSCKLLWPNSTSFDKLCLIVSDGARYMEKAIKHIKQNDLIFKNVLHVKCLAHMIHNVPERIRKNSTSIWLISKSSC